MPRDSYMHVIIYIILCTLCTCKYHAKVDVVRTSTQCSQVICRSFFSLQERHIACHVILKEVLVVYKNIKCTLYVAMAFMSITLRLVLITNVLRINALSFKKTFCRAYGLPVEEMNDLTLAKFRESSNIDCN